MVGDGRHALSLLQQNMKRNLEFVVTPIERN
jgi:hypothetical protein